MKIDPKQYSAIIIYGIGQYYERLKEELFHRIRPDYLYDRKWEGQEPESYDGIPVIKKTDLFQMENILVILATGSPGIACSMKEDLRELRKSARIISIGDVVPAFRAITGQKLRQNCPDGCYQDVWGNRIYFDATVPETLKVEFYGKNNTLTIGNRTIINQLTIVFGNEGTCRIGDRTEIVNAHFAVSYAKLIIGKDCLLSFGILIQTRDGHHIFDLGTHQRINYPRDVVVGDRVWIGCRAMLMAGAQIGAGSVVGANAVTSGSFGEHQIIAGCPAKVIREHVCWNRDNTDYFNHDRLEDCISQVNTEPERISQ